MYIDRFVKHAPFMAHLIHCAVINCIRSCFLPTTMAVADNSVFIAVYASKNNAADHQTLHTNVPDEIANVNVLQRHRTCRGQSLLPLN